ncbi:MAG: porin family protein [Candidatus Cryptobacteroides sp.]|nr:porin family protein [Rikenellaceae bacterium]MDY5746460.1 porin family protein [Candidatus Cryptobacteroides sp.]
MKKIIISLAIAIAATVSASAQVSVGAGYLNQTNKTTVSNNSSSRALNGFYAGVDLGYGLGYGLSIVPGVYYGYISGKTTALEGVAEANYVRHDIAIPVNVKYGIDILDALNVFAYAGPQFNIGLASTSTATVAGISKSINNFDENGAERRFDLSIGVGLGFDVADLIRINLGYNFGLLNRANSENVVTKANTLHVGLAVLF